MTVRRILIVDPDPQYRKDLSQYLRQQNVFEVWDTADGQDGLAAEKARPFDLIMCDNGITQPSTSQMLRALRATGSSAPFMVMMTSFCEDQVIKNLNSGASDVFCKATSTNVIKARINARLRDYDRSDDAPIEFGHFRFRPSSRRLLDCGTNKVIRLPEKEADILKFLNRSPDGWASNDQLLEHVWGYGTGVTTHTVQTHVWRLRRKIEPTPSVPRFVVTENQGYRLVS